MNTEQSTVHYAVCNNVLCSVCTVPRMQFTIVSSTLTPPELVSHGVCTDSQLCTLFRVKCIIQRSKTNLFVSVDQFDQIVPSFLIPGPQDLILRLLWSVEHDEL